jgi:hypothetical protein
MTLRPSQDYQTCMSGSRQPSVFLPDGSEHLGSRDQGNDTLAVKAPKLSDVNREGAWVPKIEIGALQETETVSARQPTITDIIMLKAPTSAGTQVGSEGVKDDVPLETVSFTFKGEVTGLEPT